MRKLVLIGLLVAGCEGAQSAPQQGLVLFPSDASHGLSGMYVVGSRVILFDTARAPRPAEAARMYGLPDFELAARFTDADGRLIASMAEGHGLPDDWSQAPALDNHVDEVAAASRALATATIDAALEPERAALLRAAQTLVEAASEGPEPSTANIAYSTYYQRIQIWKKDLKACFLVCVTYGEHSATRTKVFADGVVIGTQDRCNHGDCPAAGGMALFNTCQGPSVAAQTSLVPQSECSTSYNWASVLGTHNCNDDTTFEVRRVMQNVYNSTTGGICSDSNHHDTGGSNCDQ